MMSGPPRPDCRAVGPLGEVGRRPQRGPPCVRTYFFLPLGLIDSLTVVLGFFLTVDCLTKRPLIALRPRPPPLDLAAMTPPLTDSHQCITDVSQPGTGCLRVSIWLSNRCYARRVSATL